MSCLEEVSSNYGRIEIYIDGEFRLSDSDEWVDVFNPAKGTKIGEVPFVTGDEVDEAIESSVRAFEKWRDVPLVNRVQYLFRMKEVLEKNKEDLARIITQNHGKTIDEARGEVRRTIENVETAISIAYTLYKGEHLDNVAYNIDETLVYEPIGVFGIIGPFNFPIMSPFWYIPHAIVLGNTVVVKPSEITPLAFYWLNKLIHEIGLPPGVFNVIYGREKVGERLILHKDIVGIAFVGSTKVGRRIYELLGSSGKRGLLQCSAKNYAIVMPDADFEKTIPGLISSFFGNAGQRCLANSVLVPVGKAYDAIVPKFIEMASNLKLGYGLDETVDMGPLVSSSSKERVINFINKGIDEGARLVLDGRNVVVDEYPNGYFVGPTVFEDVERDMSIAQEEIFGPVASIIPCKSFDDAIEMANSTRYGNAASIFTSSGYYARRFRREIKAGNIGINVGIAAPMAFFPFAGMKDSFFGVVHGQITSLYFFTDVKVVISRWW
jgi:malonate-semialdehyde dehydrogenase (acetylating)/methylmalonate-semialdehyde dehydrogenase